LSSPYHTTESVVDSGVIIDKSSIEGKKEEEEKVGVIEEEIIKPK
jgi:hypothetical protein